MQFAHAEREKSAREDRKADREDRKADPEDRKADREDRKADREDRKADPEDRKADPEDRKADPEDRKADREDRKADPEDRKADREELTGDDRLEAAISGYLDGLALIRGGPVSHHRPHIPLVANRLRKLLYSHAKVRGSEVSATIVEYCEAFATFAPLVAPIVPNVVSPAIFLAIQDIADILRNFRGLPLITPEELAEFYDAPRLLSK